MRALNQGFIADLEEGGLLRPILERVKADRSLCLELRGDYVNVYYRGGNLLKLVSENTGYTAEFDARYFEGGNAPALPPLLQRPGDVANRLALWPVQKEAMDKYFGKHPKEEREAQQLILRENNFGAKASDTDYFICDIEYPIGKGRLDLVAVHWPSISKERKKTFDRRLVIGELKYGDAAIAGKSGLQKHIDDVGSFLGNPANRGVLEDEMIQVFNQKRELELIAPGRKLQTFSDEKPILLLLFANHDPQKSKLGKVLDKVTEPASVEIRVAAACMLGYGLYDEGMLSLAEACKRFKVG